MKSLKLLIKLKEKELDTKRRELSEAENNLEKLEDASKMLDTELSKEQDVVRSMYEVSFIYNIYYAENRKNKEMILFKITEYELYVNNLKEHIFRDFAELKKYTIALDNKIKAENFKLKLKEQLKLDELATNNYLKNKET